MKRSDLPEKRQGSFIGMPSHLEQVHQIFKRMFADFDSHWQQIMGHVSNQVNVQETNDSYEISVFHDGIEHPNDIEARFENGHLRLRRTVQLETKRDVDAGAVWQSYYEHFERTVPLSRSIDWNSRRITAKKGIWNLHLPKR